MRRATALLTLAALVLSGCAGNDASPSTGTDPTPGGTVGASPPAPGTTGGPGAGAPNSDNQPRSWSVGDWWKYRYISNVRGIGDFDITLVVAGETGEAYLLTAAEADVVDVTFFTHVPALGPVRKSDLAITRHGAFTPFFQFPLQDGAQWEVTVRGAWTAEAKRVRLDAGGGTVPGWRIEYRADDQLMHRIEWSADVNWVVREEAFFGADTPNHALRLLDWGHNWTGDLRTYTPRDLYTAGHTQDVVANELDPAGQEQFTVPDEGDRLLLGVFHGGMDGYCAYGIVPLDETFVDSGLYDAPICGLTALDWRATPVHPGSWSAGWLLASADAFEFFEVFLLEEEPASLA